MTLATTMISISQAQWKKLDTAFGVNLRRDIPLAQYTAARVGGPADGLIAVGSVSQLEAAFRLLMDLELPYIVLGSGANVLVSDAGFRGIVILNRAKELEIKESDQMVWAGSGASFGGMARKISTRGFSGLEWAAGIPGTVGGAVFGNAGAHGGDVAGNLVMAEILHPVKGKQQWTSAQMGYAYRSSVLKREEVNSVILSASFRFEASTVAATKALLEKFAAIRKASQPPGASMGSMFKNPPGDYAGRLIELAELKGTRMGAVVISPLHANFFINEGGCQAADVHALLQLAQRSVADRFNVDLELEIELIGDWEASHG